MKNTLLTNKSAKDASALRAISQKRANRACRRAFCWTVGLLSTSLIYAYNSYTIFAYLPTGGDILLPVIFTFLLFFMPTYSAYIAVRYFKAHYAQSFYPLLLLCTTLFVIKPPQIFRSNVSSVCSRFQQQREQLAQAFCTGKISLHEVHPKVYIPPDALRYKAGLSHNVFIDCQDDRIIAAFPLWGYLDHSEELMYRSDGSLPEPQSQSGIQDYDKMKQNWYYVAY